MTFITRNKEYNEIHGGYTLIELIVSVGLFVAVILLVTGTFLSIMSSGKKTLAIHTAIDNLNSAIESMSRDIKTGFTYHCDEFTLSGQVDYPQDCFAGSSYLAFESQKGNVNSPDDQIVYRLGDPSFPNCLSPQQICRSATSGSTPDSFYAVTAPPPELSIDGLAFRVYGADDTVFGNDIKQPRVVIVIIGSAKVGKETSQFNLETTISQRLPDT